MIGRSEWKVKISSKELNLRPLLVPHYVQRLQQSYLSIRFCLYVLMGPNATLPQSLTIQTLDFQPQFPMALFIVLVVNGVLAGPIQMEAMCELFSCGVHVGPSQLLTSAVFKTKLRQYSCCFFLFDSEAS